jgi:4,5-dihydroxyphthalate decarboxylase
MEILRLKGACSPNPLLEPLLDGTIQIPGVEIQWQFGPPGELHLMNLTEDACDIFEFSLSTFMITRDRPSERGRLQWTALPIFLTKAFLWLDFYVHKDSGIASLADLRGKRVGLPDYQMTAAIWMRIVLQELYGIQPEEIEWFNSRPPGASHGKNVEETLAPGIMLTHANRYGELEDKLQRGELDAAFADRITRAALAGVTSVRPLFVPGEAAQVMGEYRRKTGITPVNHVLVLQQRLVDRYPDLAMQLFAACERSKQEAYERARRFAAGYLLFAKDAFSQQAAVFGDDPFPSGLAANRNMLATLARASLAEGLLTSMPDISTLFCEATRST